MAYLKSTNIDGDLTISGGGNLNLADGSNVLNSSGKAALFQDGSKNRTMPSLYLTSGDYAYNYRNSDVVGFNGIYFSDSCTGNEGINFPYTTNAIDFDNYNTSTEWMTLRGYDGDLYFMDARIPTSATIAKTLWSGSWSSGSISVPDFTRYRLYVLYTATKSSGSENGTVIIAFRMGNWFRGMGGYSTNTPTITHYYFNATTSNSWSSISFIECIAERNDGTNTTDLAVTDILGVV